MTALPDEVEGAIAEGAEVMTLDASERRSRPITMEMS